MRDLHEALDQIREIRDGVERSRIYRGYRALPTALTGVFAAAAAILQPVVVDGDRDFLALWVGCAVLSAAVVALFMMAAPSPRTRDALRRLAWPFLAGAMVTVALRERAVELLPGLWQIFFALALFASRPLLPRGMVFVALFYLASGAVVLGSRTPAAMGVPFVAGQWTAAWLLQRPAGAEPGERRHG